MAKSSTPQIKIIDAETGEEMVRDMNANELAQLANDQAASELQKAAEIQKAADKAALLAQLGITEEQAKLLLG